MSDQNPAKPRKTHQERGLIVTTTRDTELGHLGAYWLWMGFCTPAVLLQNHGPELVVMERYDEEEFYGS